MIVQIPLAPRIAQRVALFVVVTAWFATTLLTVPPARAERFQFDPHRTEVSFVYTMMFMTHRGRFTDVSGTIDYDDSKPEAARVAATIKTASLTTGAPIIDHELKGAAFFNAQAAPVIAFRSRSVKPTADGTAEVAGDITVNGITKPAMLKITVQPSTEASGHHGAGARLFLAKTRIRRSAFNMTDWAFAVADEVDIEIAAVLRPRT